MAALINKIMNFIYVFVGWKFLRPAPVLLVCLSSAVIHNFSPTVLDAVFSTHALLPTLTSSKIFAPSCVHCDSALTYVT